MQYDEYFINILSQAHILKLISYSAISQMPLNSYKKMFVFQSFLASGYETRSAFLKLNVS